MHENKKCPIRYVRRSIMVESLRYQTCCLMVSRKEYINRVSRIISGLILTNMPRKGDSNNLVSQNKNFILH